MLGEIVAYSLGKAVAKRRYRRRANGGSSPSFCYGCAGEMGRYLFECHNIEDLCIDCCQCTEHSD